jgi:hypothetical protein
MTCNTHARDEKYIQNFIGNPEGKTPLGRPRYRRSVIIETDRRRLGKGVE